MEEFDKISGLTKLKELNLNESGLSEFPKVIFKLKNLEILNLNERSCLNIKIILNINPYLGLAFDMKKSVK